MAEYSYKELLLSNKMEVMKWGVFRPKYTHQQVYYYHYLSKKRFVEVHHRVDYVLWLGIY